MLSPIHRWKRMFSIMTIEAVYDRVMDTRMLEYFVAVADERNLTRAAGRLFVAQSTVSAGLRSLETELGVRLFDRDTKSVSLLPAGQDLLPIARDVLDGLDTMRSTAREAGSGLRGRVRVGTFAALRVFDLPGVLGRFRLEHPGVDVQLVTSATGSTGLIGDLVKGRLDLAFVALPVPAGVAAEAVVRRPFVAVVPESHALATRRTLSFADLAGEDWVDVLPGFGNRVQVDARLREEGITRRLSAEVADLPSVGPFVAAGIGVAVVPDVIDAVGCRVVPLSDRMPEWVVSLAVRRGGERRHAIAALAEALRSGSAEAGRSDDGGRSNAPR
ncbi:LysR family transcriptional regulator [Labedella populi]|uniref:LysR family transcriptional regulator n=2 Tax=Labedella populi TaxID=2498850 RepID=A0A444QD78_9MICO|nr:LysR family transcriptional regulator [Labedella populi]